MKTRKFKVVRADVGNFSTSFSIQDVAAKDQLPMSPEALLHHVGAIFGRRLGEILGLEFEVVLPPESDRRERVAYFEQLWAVYPRKVGKKAALARFLQSVKTLQDEDDINRALAVYLEDRKDSPPDKIALGETWFYKGWKKWVPED